MEMIHGLEPLRPENASHFSHEVMDQRVGGQTVPEHVEAHRQNGTPNFDEMQRQYVEQQDPLHQQPPQAPQQ